MTKAWGLVIALAACGSDPEMFPVGGNTDGGTGGFGDAGPRPDGTLTDAGPTGPDATVAPVDANVFQGRVCLVNDPRNLNACATTGADGITVRLGTASTVTAADGTFFISGQSGANLVWRITGANIVSSYEVLADYQIPAIPRTVFNQMLTANSVMQVPGEGSVMIEVSSNGVGVAGATAEVTPLAFYEPYYDGTTATAWTQTATAGNGAIWIPGIDVGNVSVAIAATGEKTITVPVFDDGITFANVIF